MAIVWECPCGVRAKTCYLTPDGKAPTSETCPICKRKLKKVGTSPMKIKSEAIMAMASVALRPL